METGQMYATDNGGSAAQQYWPIIWNDEICSGAPYWEFGLRTVNIHGTFAEPKMSSVLFNKHSTRITRAGSIDRDICCSRNLWQWFQDNPSAGARVARIGSGEQLSSGMIRDVGRTGSVFLKRFGLDCLTSGLVDAVACSLREIAALTLATRVCMRRCARLELCSMDPVFDAALRNCHPRQ